MRSLIFDQLHNDFVPFFIPDDALAPSACRCLLPLPLRRARRSYNAHGRGCLCRRWLSGSSDQKVQQVHSFRLLTAT